MRLLRFSCDQFWLGVVCFILYTTLVAMGLSLAGLTPQTAAIALFVGSAATIFTLRQVRLAGRHPADPPADHGLWAAAIWICFGLYSLRTFLWLIFVKDGQIAVLARNNLGDLPLHIQYIRFFTHGAPLWPTNPLHAHSSIGYPFGIDYFNAVLDASGLTGPGGSHLWGMLIATGLLCAAATGIALERWGRAFGMAGFLFNGGVAGLAIFRTGQWLDYQQTMDWKSIPLSLFVTQRGFLYALPAGLLLLWQWRRSHAFSANSGAPFPNDAAGAQRPPHPTARALPFWLEWLIYATLPLFHIHTFLFLSAILGTLALFGNDRRRLWLLAAAAFLPATGIIYLITDGFTAAGNLGWLPGWMQGDHFDPVYWLRNFGALPFFLGWLLVVLILKKQRPALLFVVPALAFFLATFFIKFSPWEWDNTKLMMWSYLVLLPWLWQTLREKTHPLVCATSVFLLYASGFVSLWGGLGKSEEGYPLANQSEVLSVAQATRDLPILDVFAAAPGFAHPLAFAGRRLALGYHGHMVGHGTPYLAEKNAMDTLMNGHDDWEKAARFLGVRYIYWGPEEEKNWPASEKPWLATAELIATDTWGEIYRLP